MCHVCSRNMIMQVHLKLTQRKTPTRTFAKFDLNQAACVWDDERTYFYTPEVASDEQVILPYWDLPLRELRAI